MTRDEALEAARWALRRHDALDKAVLAAEDALVSVGDHARRAESHAVAEMMRAADGGASGHVEHSRQAMHSAATAAARADAEVRALRASLARAGSMLADPLRDLIGVLERCPPAPPPARRRTRPARRRRARRPRT